MTERGMLDTEFQQLKLELNRMASSTTFGGQQILEAGNIAFSSTQVSTNNHATSFLSELADMNGDRILDIVSGNGNVAIQYGNGDGSYRNAVTIGGAYSFTLADFDGNGTMDIVASVGGYNANTLVRAYLNNGTGTFTQQNLYTSANAIGNIQTGDFNADGRMDVVFNDEWALGNNVTALLSQSNGSYAASVNNMVNARAGLAVGDFNNDGIDDFMTSTGGGANSRVFLGGGNGLTGLATQIFSGNNGLFGDTRSVDIDNDGDLDLYGNNGGNIVFLLNNGSGVFTPGSNIAMGTTNRNVRILDFNGDGNYDIVTYDRTNFQMVWRQGLGNMNFGAAQTIAVPNGTTGDWEINFGDIDRDGRVDLLFGGATNFTTVYNQSATGLDSSVRVSEGNGADNIGFRVGSLRLNYLDQNLASSRITSIGQAERADTAIRNAANKLAEMRTHVGATINRLESTSNNLATQIENLDNARSAYLDLDVAAEMTRFTSLQITQQAGISMLAQANKTQQMILRLLNNN